MSEGVTEYVLGIITSLPEDKVIELVTSALTVHDPKVEASIDDSWETER